MTHRGGRSGRQSRRRFFAGTLDSLLDPLTSWLEGSGDRRVPTRLRPPGALPEASFVATCAQCAACVDICPARAIRIAPGAPPWIDPDEGPCVVCDGLQCTHVCPSGALQPLDDPHAIAMGRAEVYAPLCVRSHGDDCVTCVESCPMGAEALSLTGDGPPVVHDACTGCGVCQSLCPTLPKAIVVAPSDGR